MSAMERWDQFMVERPVLAWSSLLAMLAVMGAVLAVVLTFAGFWAFAAVGVAASIAIIARM